MSFNRPMYDFCEGKKRLQESVDAGTYGIETPLICKNCLPNDPRIIPNKTGVSMDKTVPWRFYAGPVDVESDLFNLNRAYSNCPTKKYRPNAKNCLATNQGQPAGAGVALNTQEATNYPDAGVYRKESIYPEGPKGSRQMYGGKGVVEGFDGRSNQTLKDFPKAGQRCGDGNLTDFDSCGFNTEDTRLSNPPNTLKGTGINRFQPLCFNPQEKIFFPGDYQVSTRLVFRDNHRPCIPSLDVISRAPLPPPAPMPCNETTKTCSAFTKAMYQYDVCG